MYETLADSIKRLVSDALREDLDEYGDITSKAVIPETLVSEAYIVARESLIICGHQVAKEVCSQVDASLEYEELQKEGDKIVFLDSEVKERVSKKIAIIKGSSISILTAERTMLNFFQRLSGISSISNEMSEILKGKSAKIVDTRKTTPAWRLIEKYAVKVGGGENHRIGLYDAFLIKNNHIDAIGGDLKASVQACKDYDKVPKDTFLQVEVRDLKELKLAIEADPDSILLDNMSPSEVNDASDLIRESSSEIIIELSGGINLSNLAEYADCRVDRISSGALTHSAKSKDLSLQISLKS